MKNVKYSTSSFVIIFDILVKKTMMDVKGMSFW